ncbi:MAG: RHS repeat-associated core domain-containing protein [Clostridia bacterium]|nr:RHS repeat-associated core domain-containing protein [Clostridia bacterium]
MTGKIIDTYYYDAFGNILESSGDTYNPIRYAGYQYDEETGLYYLNARMYDPKIARFLQEDTYCGNPNDQLSLNLYTYCQNEPLMYYDPSGHFGEWLKRLFGWEENEEETLKSSTPMVYNTDKICKQFLIPSFNLAGKEMSSVVHKNYYDYLLS